MGKYKIHYDPYHMEYPPDSGRHLCSTYASEDRDWETTVDKNKVTCKKCIKMFEVIDAGWEDTEKAIVEEMGDMADFWNKTGKYQAYNEKTGELK